MRRIVGQIRREFPFDLIHAHFTYPDGVVAAMLGRVYGIPTVITEHVLWLPWIRREPLVRRQAAWAVSACDAHLSVSDAVRRHVADVVGPAVPRSRLRIVPNVVEERLFAARPPELPRIPGQILFVGVVRAAKGMDVLLHALAELRQQRPDARLVVVGDPFYRAYQKEAERLQALADQLGVADIVRNMGGQPPSEVARLMAESSVVVLPSRRESFGSVLIEAMACGTPVVATRCGGPEEVVTPEVGLLVPPEDRSALTAALVYVLDHPHAYDPATLRRSALDRFGPAVVARRLADQYVEVLSRSSAGRSTGREWLRVVEETA
jgi:glycosyltransferase involved in cell wall biosynthesis